MTTTTESQISVIKSVRLTEEEENRLQRLQEKKRDPLFEIAFCGHFSAGKSSILNELIGNSILPVSPIPASANVIRIRRGDTGLTIHTPDKDDKVYKGNIPWGSSQWGTNGTDIMGITITAPLDFLGNTGCILDTPGVDSTDSSHEAVTVDQLFTTDAVVYVMDYNHVQSETNLNFLKKLTDEKKPVYIIINQVDKHNDDELSLDEYIQSVMDTLKNWNIEYQDIYTTSMKNKSHPANEFEDFKNHIKSVLHYSSDLTSYSASLLEYGFAETVKKRLYEDYRETVEAIHDDMSQAGFNLKDLEKQKELENKLEEIRNYAAILRERYISETSRLYKNVILFPYTTTELARDWLESRQKGFKAGLLFSRKKTAAEQKSRMDKLLRSLQDNVKTQLLFHLHPLFDETDRSELKDPERFEHALNELNYTVPEELLEKNIKDGPVSRDYVYHFTAAVSDEIVKKIKQKAEALLELKIDLMEDMMNQKEADITEKLFSYEALNPFQKRLEKAEEDYDIKRHELEDKPESDASTRFSQALKKTGSLKYEESEATELFRVEIPVESTEPEVSSVYEEEPDHRDLPVFDAKEAENKTKIWKDILKSFQSHSLLATEREQFLERLSRFEERTFVISLFGAFSAGKSSFANALLGDKVMPVSPHPATASVNTVRKSDSTHPHGTAVVKFKTEDEISKEIMSAAGSLSITLTVGELRSWKPDEKNVTTSWHKAASDYLLTLKKGLSANGQLLSETVSSSVSELSDFTLIEETACLVDSIDIYYDSPLTEQGIVLVDTPGVNSVHSRHTNTAFRQLKESDAIFYLTYYNHSFSKADQYFLQQMSKINDSFSENKLYFILNAADLASDEKELLSVKEHVKTQLIQSGITDPRLYHVSSKKGLAAKLGKVESDPGFSIFEDAFYKYTIEQLKALGWELINHEASQYTGKLYDMLLYIDEDRDYQQEKKKKLASLCEQEEKRLEEASFTAVERNAFNELDQFTLYLRQRMTYVLNDFFPETVNVAVINGNDRRTLRRQLNGALQEWKGKSEQFLNQELEAVIIRLENALKKLSYEWTEAEAQTIREKLEYLAFSDKIHEVRVDYSGKEIKLNINTDHYTSYLKSKKDFFENGKIKELKEAVVTDGAEKAAHIIRDWHEEVKHILTRALNEQEERTKSVLSEAIRNEAGRFDRLLDPEVKKQLTLEYERFRNS